MAGRNSQISRLYRILHLFEGAPHGLTVTEIWERVTDQGHAKTKRTIYRVKKDEVKAPPKPRVKKPSERYPDLPAREWCEVEDPAPQCPCRDKEMTPSGMTEDSEQLTAIPKKYEILRRMRMNYRCSCQGAVLTVPSPPRIIPGSSYSDEMILDVALSQYYDHIS